MPAYDYECDACHARYELRQGFDAATTHVCEQCGKGTAKRVLTAPRVLFKGSGWYVTDSRKADSATSDSSSTSSTESRSSSTASDSAKSTESSGGGASAATTT